MRLIPEGRKFVITGALPDHSRASAQQALAALGASIQKSVSSKTEFLIAGRGAGSKIDKARSLGITVLDADQFAALLEHGEIELEAPEEAEVAEAIPLGGAIGELRGALDGAASSEKWSRIVYALERCDPELMEVAVEYVEGYLGGWDDHAMGVWAPFSHKRQEEMDPFELEVLEAMSSGWTRGLPSNELRVAPPHWCHEMIQGVDSPKHRVVRALNLERMRLNGTMLSKLFEREHLVNLKVLNLGNQNKTSKTFFKKLRQSENMRSLEEIWLYRLREKEIVGLEGDTKLDSLRKVRFQESWHSDEAAWATLLASGSFGRVETIAIHWGIPAEFLTAFLDVQPRSVRRLELYIYASGLADVLGRGICAHIETLALFGPCQADVVPTLLGHREISRLEAVDLSALEPWHDMDLEQILASALEAHPEELSGLERLVLGPHKTPKVLAALEGVDVEVV